MPRDLIYQYAKEFTAGRIASGFSHCHRVYHLARELSENYDDDILYAACYLHDTDISEDGHIKSAEKAEQILQEIGFSANKIEKVVESIKTHWPDNKKPELLEAQLLHDANLIDSLGAIGVIRLSIGATYWYHYKTLKQVLNLIKEYRDKAGLLLLPRSKEMAKEKIKFMDLIIKELEEEENL
jgi:HD superfamily phosphodiesterase